MRIRTVKLGIWNLFRGFGIRIWDLNLKSQIKHIRNLNSNIVIKFR